ncbi:hypothetical protein [Pseudonocardia sp. ICBG1293]|uniref:hypothetical protein n=1 Tax=Pseudonocardia sp. ICBG1293 TaxID=2844382 RepID=UPI001CC967F2|nr:hypothetical protein [Pseudonocardia sp. ICBG1293]
MRTRLCATLLGLLLVGGCGVTLEDEPEPLDPATGTPSPTPTLTVLPPATAHVVPPRPTAAGGTTGLAPQPVSDDVAGAGPTHS